MTNLALTVVPKAVSGPDAGLIAAVLSGLRGSKRRTAFLCTARSVIDWRGQAASAQRQTNLLNGVPVLVILDSDDTTIPPHHHREFASRVPGAVTVAVPGAGHYPHETDSDQVVAPIQAFLSTTAPFAYSEASWVDRLTNATMTNPAANPERSSIMGELTPSR